ncbi:hypothetical protein Tcan_06441 [Toxocara canis]|uniref:Uncharacterized protein n=1 Tax=Toxocara canis TaxID=6265 RepID=A0A0B2VPM7_TOXCA|nr:hypothetical protein Tcan_06441 [Toxocara canis]
MEEHASTAQANDLPLQNSVGVICAKEKLTKASSSNENSLKGLTSNENPIKVPLSNENTIQARLPNENSAEILQTIEGQISPSSEKPVKSSPPKNELKEHGAKYNNDSKVEKEKKNIAEMASFESVRDQNQKSFEAVTPERKSVEVIKPQQDMIKAFIQEEAAKKLAMLQGQIAEASTLTEKTIHETTLSKKETTELAKLQETSANNCSLEETIVRRPVLQKDDIKLYRAHCHEVVRINDTEQAIKASLQKGLNDVAKEVESVTANAVVDSKGELNTKSIFNLSKVVAVHQASATASNTSDKAAGTGAAEEKALQDKNAGSASSDKSVESGRKTTHQKNDTKVATCTQKVKDQNGNVVQLIPPIAPTIENASPKQKGLATSHAIESVANRPQTVTGVALAQNEAGNAVAAEQTTAQTVLSNLKTAADSNPTKPVTMDAMQTAVQTPNTATAISTNDKLTTDTVQTAVRIPNTATASSSNEKVTTDTMQTAVRIPNTIAASSPNKKVTTDTVQTAVRTPNTATAIGTNDKVTTDTMQTSVRIPNTASGPNEKVTTDTVQTAVRIPNTVTAGGPNEKVTTDIMQTAVRIPNTVTASGPNEKVTTDTMQTAVRTPNTATASGSNEKVTTHTVQNPVRIPNTVTPGGPNDKVTTDTMQTSVRTPNTASGPNEKVTTDRVQTAVRIPNTVTPGGPNEKVTTDTVQTAVRIPNTIAASSPNEKVTTDTVQTAVRIPNTVTAGGPNEKVTTDTMQTAVRIPNTVTAGGPNEKVTADTMQTAVRTPNTATAIGTNDKVTTDTVQTAVRIPNTVTASGPNEKVTTDTVQTVVRFPNTIAARSPNDRVTMDTMQTAVRIPNTLSVGGTDKNTTTGTLQNAIESRQQGGKSEIRERIEEVTKKMEQAVESTNALCEVEENKVEPQQNIPCQKHEPGNRKLLKTGVISTRDDESPRRANQELPNKELQGGNNIAVANSQNDRSKVATARVEIDSPPEPPDVSLAKQSEGIVEGNCQAIRSEALASETSPTLPNGSKLISRSVPASHLKDYSAICGERNRADEGDEMFIADTELKHERSPSEEEEFVDAVSEVSERCSEASDHATFTLEEPALPDDLSSLDGSPDEMLVEDPPTQGMPRTLSIDTELTDSMVTLSAKGDIAAIQELPNKELQGGNNIAVANSQNDRSKVATARVEIDSPPEPPDVSLAKQSEGIVEGNCQAIRSEALASETSPTLPNGSKLISRSVPASHLKDYSAICGERNRADEGDEMFIADTELKHERSPSEEEEFVDAVSEVSERCSEASDHATFTLEEPALPDDLSSLDGSPDEMLVEDPPTQDSMVTLSAKGDIAAIQV